MATTMAAIAQRAGVNADTVYTAVGAKPALFRLLIETALSGEDHAVPATNRDYVRDMQAEPDAVNKLAIYAAAISRIHARLGPLFGVLQTAAPSSPELAALWHTDRRTPCRQHAPPGRRPGDDGPAEKHGPGGG